MSSRRIRESQRGTGRQAGYMISGARELRPNLQPQLPQIAIVGRILLSTYSGSCHLLSCFSGSLTPLFTHTLLQYYHRSTCLLHLSRRSLSRALIIWRGPILLGVSRCLLNCLSSCTWRLTVE